MSSKLDRAIDFLMLTLLLGFLTTTSTVFAITPVSVTPSKTNTYCGFGSGSSSGTNLGYGCNSTYKITYNYTQNSILSCNITGGNTMANGSCASYTQTQICTGARCPTQYICIPYACAATSSYSCTGTCTAYCTTSCPTGASYNTCTTSCTATNNSKGANCSTAVTCTGSNCTGNTYSPTCTVSTTTGSSCTGLTASSCVALGSACTGPKICPSR